MKAMFVFRTKQQTPASAEGDTIPRSTKRRILRHSYSRPITYSQIDWRNESVPVITISTLYQVYSQ